MNERISTWSYRPGPWYAVFGPDLAVALPEAQRDQVIGLWALVDGGAGFDQVLDALLAGGLSALPGFALISTEDGPVRVLVRGAGVIASVQAVEEVVLDGGNAGTWVERSVPGATAVTLVVPEDPAPERAPETDHVIPAGLVRVSRVDRPLGGAASRAADAAPVLAVVPDVLPAPAPEPLDEPVTESIAELATEEVDEYVGEDTVPVEDTGATALLHISDGQTVSVDRPVLIGRAPEARGSVSPEERRLVTVPSRLNEISSAHIEIRPGSGPGCAVATDMGSTNGSVLEQPGLAPESLEPGIAVDLLAGAVINLGDGISIRVSEA